ncbi:DUF5994 family protein [Winogradskya humida]|uniref:Uncharacterized protein n=1 Tax=Winogradskya humida TaxID=113566 RepID=A0ABQ3ZYN1_9ACTN|nr:DUF5994 family protein [Actinoplanes humidus]GIE23721.1 hypothetical protein Ahu01nite_068230 [Actinoplanes humidus]
MTAVAAPTVRLRLAPGDTRGKLLDGAWWPRTNDLTTELPQLVAELNGQRGTITHALARTEDWQAPHPKRLPGDRRAVRLAWFSSQPHGLVTLMTDFGRDRYDLVIVPAGASGEQAETVMAAAADPDGERRAPDLLTGLTA